jgi:adenosylcobinamide-phosphate synthase
LLLPPLALLAASGLLADRLLGEPRRFHPLVGFGWLADRLENALRRGAPGHPLGNRLRGLIAWCLLVLPVAALAWSIAQLPFGWVLDVLLLWFALGGQSLAEHAQAIAQPLAEGNLEQARLAVGRIVSRDTTALDEAGVAKAAVESVLENGADAVFAALLWFALLGGPGALAYRLANTLDGMWGYRDERRRYFGWAAARIDDLLNLVPARLTALTYAALGRTGRALACWRAQAPAWSSPNAGPVMAAGAGSLGLRLGGAAIYHGQVEERPVLGEDRCPGAIDIGRALDLVRRGAWLWLAAFLVGSLVHA